MIVRNEKTKKVEFINAGCIKKDAIAKLKSLTKKGSIGAVLNSNAEIIEKSISNPKKNGDMKYEKIYSMIGQFHLDNLKLFKSTPKNEKDAGLVWVPIIIWNIYYIYLLLFKNTFKYYIIFYYNLQI